MDINFENLQIWHDKEDATDDTPIIVACRDREAENEERWVVAALTISQARNLRDYLNALLKE